MRQGAAMDRFVVRSPKRGREGEAGPSGGTKRARLASGPSNAARLVACPVCYRQVPTASINSHIDSKACGAAPVARASAGGGGEPGVSTARASADSGGEPRAPAARATSADDGEPTGALSDTIPASCRARREPALRGLWIADDFLSEADERALVAFLDDAQADPAGAWREGSFNGPCLRKAWGVRTDLRARTFAAPLAPMPPPLAALARRLRALGERDGVEPLRRFRPNEANALDYRRARGHRIDAHCDDRQLSGPVLVNVSLAGDAVMQYAEDTRSGASGGAPRRHEVRLRRRSVQVQSGEVRYRFTHAIENRGLLSGRRISITFRQNAFDGYHC